MSAIATFGLMDKAVLDELRKRAQQEAKVKKRWFSRETVVIDHFWRWFNQQVTNVGDFSYSGFYYNGILPYLEEVKGIDLSRTELYELGLYVQKNTDSYTTLLFTEDDKKAILDKLDPANYSSAEMRSFSIDLLGKEGDFPEEGFIEAIRALHDSLDKVDRSSVLIFEIG